MYAGYHIGNNFTRRGYDGNSKLPKSHVYFVIEQGRGRLLQV